jgi:hypothetical protein
MIAGLVMTRPVDRQSVAVLPVEAARLASDTDQPLVAPTAAPTSTRTPTATAWPTATPTHTRRPTFTPIPSRTPRPSRTRTATTSPVLSPSLTFTPLPGDLNIIGYSVAGRPLQVYSFGNGAVHRMVIAGIHGGYEWNTIALADKLIVHFTAHPELVPPDVTLFILRSLNPDGEARARTVDGRVNENGVDLNRNWPALWQADWPRRGCWIYRPVTGGAEAASEPETQALMNYLGASHIDALINYHSAALGIFAGGQPPDAASLNLAEAVDAVSNYPYPPIDTGCHFTGQLIDWASQNGIAALDIELTNHRNTDFEQNLRIMQVLLTWRQP